MSRPAALLLAAALLPAAALPSPAAAWGLNGHRTVGQIAANHLAPETARAVAELIGPQSLARVSTWADEIRSDPAWAHADPWHYIDFPDEDTLETAERAPEGDVLEAMERFEAVLRDREAPLEERARALKFLVHFVGDVHQPLHVGRGDDRGGNEVVVLWFGEPTDLHTVWDTKLIEDRRLSYTELAEFLDHPRPEEVARWQADGYREWIRESKALRETVYDLGDRRLSWSYADRSWPIVERRLLQAGIRLAGLLDRALAPEE